MKIMTEKEYIDKLWFDLFEAAQTCIDYAERNKFNRAEADQEVFHELTKKIYQTYVNLQIQPGMEACVLDDISAFLYEVANKKQITYEDCEKIQNVLFGLAILNGHFCIYDTYVMDKDNIVAKIFKI